jgi:TRAP-type uncharacterized transport system substrate-binding protein
MRRHWSRNEIKMAAAAPPAWRRKGVLRAISILAVSAVIAAVISSFGVIRDLGAFHASLLTGSPGGAYYVLGSQLAERAKGDGSRLDIVATAGSVENVSRLIAGRDRCVEQFAFVQDGTPIPSGSGLELLGRLPEPESLLLLGRNDRPPISFADLRGASIGIGPEQSGTAYLARLLLGDADLAGLNIRTSYHELEEQAQLVAQGSLDFAVYVMRDDAEFLRSIIRQYRLDIIDLQDLQGLVGRHPWLSLGQVPQGRYDLVRQIPPHDKVVAQVNTLVVTSPCAKRANRIGLLALLGAELPRFVRSNPPGSTSSATKLPLASEARQFFLTGEPEFADRYFPWLVNIMSPAYWLYLVMAVTAIFNALKGFSRFQLWRIDATREKLEAEIRRLAGDVVRHGPTSNFSTKQLLVDRKARAEAQDILSRLAALRTRCARHANSFATPMGDEMFYRYQQSLIDDTTSVLNALLGPSPEQAVSARSPV